MKAKWLACFMLALALLGCTTSKAEDTVTVFAASSLTHAFNDLGEAFQAQNEGVKVVFNFAGSSQLAAQLSEGAAADVFASANPAQLHNVIEDGRITAGTDAAFASNHLTIIVPADNPGNINAFADLAQPDVQLILATAGVPIRAYTDEIVAAMDANFQGNFYNNLVSEEDNVRQVAAKVALGEADAGIVYTSDVTPDIAGQVQQIAITEARNVIAIYPIAPLTDTSNPELAQRFINYVLSAEGQAILAHWGFDPPPVK